MMNLERDRQFILDVCAENTPTDLKSLLDHTEDVEIVQPDGADSTE